LKQIGESDLVILGQFSKFGDLTWTDPISFQTLTQIQSRNKLMKREESMILISHKLLLAWSMSAKPVKSAV